MTSSLQEKLTAVSADYQSAGRGTGERSWHGTKVRIDWFLYVPGSRLPLCPYNRGW